MGYCMGGPIIMRTAAAVPDRISAAILIRGGGLVTKKRQSALDSKNAGGASDSVENDDAREPIQKRTCRTLRNIS